MDVVLSLPKTCYWFSSRSKSSQLVTLPIKPHRACRAKKASWS